MITAGIVQSAAEALALVHNAGLPLEKFAAAMAENGSNSGTLALKLPMMMSGDFEPHFSVKHMLKDVEIATRMARSHGLHLPATEIARESLVEQAEQGHADEDYAAVARSFFPDGPLGKSAEVENGEEEEQDDLTSWADRRPSEPAIEQQKERVPEAEPERQPEPQPEPVARNGHSEEAPESEGRQPIATEDAEEEMQAKAEEVREVEDTREEELQPKVEDVREVEATVEEERTPTEEPVASAEVESIEDERPAPTEVPEVAAQVADRKAEGEEEDRPRGFFSRLFGKSADY
jgi:DNA polymerase III gamma/tau subunit